MSGEAPSFSPLFFTHFLHEAAARLWVMLIGTLEALSPLSRQRHTCGPFRDLCVTALSESGSPSLYDRGHG